MILPHVARGPTGTREACDRTFAVRFDTPVLEADGASGFFSNLPPDLREPRNSGVQTLMPLRHNGCLIPAEYDLDP